MAMYPAEVKAEQVMLSNGAALEEKKTLCQEPVIEPTLQTHQLLFHPHCVWICTGDSKNLQVKF